MKWLETRLGEIRRRPIELAKHLKIAPPRVYEMLKGKRRLQQDEIPATAIFLEWPIEIVADLAAGKPLSEVLATDRRIRPSDWVRDIPVYATEPLDDGGKGGFIMSLRVVGQGRRSPRLEGRTDIFGFYCQTESMSPWRERGHLVYCETGRPVAERDHAVIELKGAKISLLRKVIKMDDKTVTLDQYNPPKRPVTILRSKIKTMCRVLEWNEVMSD